MNPGQFRQRITFQQKSNDVNENGFPVPDSKVDWMSVITVWAMAKTSKSYQGLESHESNAVQNVRNTRWIIRYRKGLSENMRIIFEGRIFKIEAILPDDELKKTLTIVCKEVM